MPSDNEADIRELWYDAAHRASDAQLVACVAVALIAAVGFGIAMLVDVRRTLRWWPLILPAFFVGTFGVWGIADRELGARDTGKAPRLSTRMLSVVKICSVVAAGIVGALAAIGLLELTIGTWVS
jgi:hypothetical protein